MLRKTDNFGKQFCRLCFSIINDERFEEIKDVMRYILDVLLLKLDLNDRSEQIICNACSLKVMEAFKFKSMCLYPDNTINPYVNDETGYSVDLREIFAKEKGKEQLITTLDHTICRLCTQIIKEQFILVQEVDVDMINMYIPEINFLITKNPTICKQCFDSIGIHSNFIKNCLKVEEKIKCFPPGSLWTLAFDSCVETKEIGLKLEKNEYEDLIKSNFTAEKSKDEDETTIKTECIDIKSEYDSESGASLDVLPHSSAHDTISTIKESKPILKTHVTELRHPPRKKVHDFGKSGYKTASEKCLAIHQSVHNEALGVQMYKCDTCDYITIHKSILTCHQIGHKDPLEVPILKCDTNGYETNCKSILTDHTLTHKEPSQKQIFKCIYCQFESKSKRGISRHIFIHEGRLLDPKEATKIMHMLRLNKPFSIKKLTCEICNFTTLNKSKFSDHQLRHKGEKPHTCNECDYRALRKSSLKVHLLSHKKPSELPLYKCDKCDYETKQKGSLMKHQIRHKSASEANMHKCLYCAYETKYKPVLKDHIIYLHRSKLLDSEENLRVKHVLKLRKVITVKTYKCDKCDYETVHKREFANHQSKHGILSLRYRCEECSYATMYKNHLVSHQLSHKEASEVPVYTCDLCYFETKYKRSFDKHYLKHGNPSKAEIYQCKEDS
ncbi:zinc finger protein 25-like [Anoplophora glabripennis]|uniref:zinc finger protein 25-like n=1 Tax=Anoplophora glabripennis TaxID=217634 RepID=UPI000874FDDC|nr:zinc finger protein 25-like [Anoplophora glabripennis]